MKSLRPVCLLLLLTVLSAQAPVVSADALDLDQYRGKVVLLDFWASWCGPCRQSFPWLNEMQGKYADQGLVIIGVNVDKERADADKFLQKYPSKFRIVYDATGALASHYGILGMPSSVILDGQGEVIGGHSGFREKKRAAYESNLVEHLREQGQTPEGLSSELNQ